MGVRQGEADSDANAPTRGTGSGGGGGGGARGGGGRRPPPTVLDGVSTQRWNYPLLGLIQRKSLKRAKSLSKEHMAVPCSMARAAR